MGIEAFDDGVSKSAVIFPHAHITHTNNKPNQEGKRYQEIRMTNPMGFDLLTLKTAQLVTSTQYLRGPSSNSLPNINPSPTCPIGQGADEIAIYIYISSKAHE